MCICQYQTSHFLQKLIRSVVPPSF
jgi:hypothetical protein